MYGKVRNRNLFIFKIFAGFFNITTQVYSTVGGGSVKEGKGADPESSTLFENSVVGKGGAPS